MVIVFIFKPSSTFMTTLSFLLFPFLLFAPAFADNDSRNTAPPDFGDIAKSNGSQSQTPPTPQSDLSPFKPSIAVIVAVLTTMFSITFLLLLYAKHCKRGGPDSGIYTNGAPNSAARKNSGIDRSVIESLPLFRFSSLRGQKDGLECAVCLNRFEPTEVLRLLPKCKHAFHVECVDTWLDAHSTCPLCRYRVDPEDVLLIDEPKILHENQLVVDEEHLKDNNNNHQHALEHQNDVVLELESGGTTMTKRVLGRHSSAGERTTTWGGVGSGGSFFTTSFRLSFDSLKRKGHCSSNSDQAVAVGCFDRPRKDGLLLTTSNISNNSNVSTNNDAAPSSAMYDHNKNNYRTSSDRRLEHRIIVGGGGGSGLNSGGLHFQRWSDVLPSDLLYLKSEMIISDSRRISSNQRNQQQQQQQNEGGRNVINERSVSEITGLNRFSSSNCRNCNSSSNSREKQRQAGAVSRWMAWVSSSASFSSSSSSSSSSKSQPAVPLERTTANPDAASSV